MTAVSANSRSSISLPFLLELCIIALPGCEELGEKIDRFISNWRDERKRA